MKCIAKAGRTAVTFFASRFTIRRTAEALEFANRPIGCVQSFARSRYVRMGDYIRLGSYRSEIFSAVTLALHRRDI